MAVAGLEAAGSILVGEHDGNDRRGIITRSTDSPQVKKLRAGSCSRVDHREGDSECDL